MTFIQSLGNCTKEIDMKLLHNVA